jgi:hypothetical protein
VDIRRALKKRTERVPLRALERRGFRSVQVLDMRTIERIVSEAVDQVFVRHSGDVSQDERAAIEREAKQEFLTLLEEHKKVLAAKTEADRVRAELQKRLGELGRERERQEQALKQAQSKELQTHDIAISPEAFAELETHLRQLFDTLMTEEQRRSLAELGPKALRGLNEFERELATMIDGLLNRERSRYLSRERQEHNQKIELLERRLFKLNKALADTETHLKHVIAAKSIDPGLASIYDSVQGLDLLEVDYERKRELLHVIFVENLELQQKEVRPEDRNREFSRPERPAPPEPEGVRPPPPDFAPPREDLIAETAF